MPDCTVVPLNELRRSTGHQHRRWTRHSAQRKSKKFESSSLAAFLTGTVPFVGSPIAVFRQHADAPPRRVDGVRPEVWAVLDAFLAKQPDVRPIARVAADGVRLLSAGRATRARPLHAVTRDAAPAVAASPLVARPPAVAPMPDLSTVAART